MPYFNQELTDLESIIASSKNERLDLSFLNLESSIFLNYFVSHMSHKHLKESLEKGADLFSLLAMDYFLKFKKTVEESNSFIGKTREEIISQFAGHLQAKDPKNYTRINQDSFALGDVETNMAATFYLNLLGEPKTNGLLKKASNLNDLKAVLLVNKMVPGLIYEKVHEILDSDLNPEQVFIVLSKIKYEEKKIADFSSYQKQLQEIVSSLGLIDSALTEESGKTVVSLREKIISLDKKELEEFKDKDGYVNIISNFLKTKEAAMTSINTFIGKHTSQLLEVFDYSFVKSDNPNHDLLELDKKISLFDQLKKNYSCFGLSQDPELGKVEDWFNGQRTYLLEVIGRQEKLKKLRQRLETRLPWVEKVDNFTLELSVIQELLRIKEKAKIGLLYKKWLDDHYLANQAQFVYNASHSLVDFRVDNKINQILEHAKFQFMSFLSRFKSSDDLEKDLEKSRQQVEKAKKVIELYQFMRKELRESAAGLENIEFVCYKFEKAKGMSDEIKEMATRLNGYKKEIEKLASEKIKSKVVSQVNLCYHNLEQMAAQLQSYSKDTYLKNYSSPMKLIEENIKAKAEITASCSVYLDQRLRVLLERAEKLSDKATLSLKDILSMKGFTYLFNRFKLEQAKTVLKSYVEEIENICQVKFFAGEKPSLEKYHHLIEKKSLIIEGIKYLLYSL